MLAGESIDKHVTILGVIYIVLSMISLFVAALLFMILAGVGFISGDDDVFIITGIVGAIIAVFLFVLALPGIVCGIGLIMRAPWARILGIILAILNLLNFPLGTILGIYALWVLFHDDAKRVFNPSTI